MKLPRWLLIAMIASSTLLLLAAVGTWWLTWPERTFRAFIVLAQAGNFDEMRRMMVPPRNRPRHYPEQEPREQAPRTNPWQIQAQRRSVRDIFVGRQKYNLASSSVTVAELIESGQNDFVGASDLSVRKPHLLDFVVERGSVYPLQHGVCFMRWSHGSDPVMLLANGDVHVFQGVKLPELQSQAVSAATP